MSRPRLTFAAREQFPVAARLEDLKREKGQRLVIVPATLEEANEFVRQHHRHHRPVVGHKFSLGVCDEAGTIRGVAIVGRPVARRLDDGMTLEVNRVATDGCDNACSALYGAARRAAFALGFRKLITYTLPEEGGASLRGAGWKCIGLAGKKDGKGWSCPSRPRVDTHPLQRKMLWEAPPVAPAIPQGVPGEEPRR